VNLVSDCTFPAPQIVSRQSAQHAVPHSLSVACTYLLTHHPPLTSITPVLANLSFIPDKYHVFINPPLRRVYLGDRVDNKAIINDLQSKIVRLELRIETIKSASLSAIREKQISIQKAHFALYEAKKEAQLALDEAEKAARIARDKASKDAQLALYKAGDDLRLANLSLEEVRAENNALKSQWVPNNFSSVEPHPIELC
jgi:hypothetical protein